MVDKDLLRFLGVPDGYIAGLGRDYPHPKIAHLYEGTFENPGDPMCVRGWNRDEGQSYSIWRNNIGERGVCQVCLRRAQKGLKGVQPKRTQHSVQPTCATSRRKNVLSKSKVSVGRTRG